MSEAKRIEPDPPTRDPRDSEHFDVWGFADSGFAVTPDGDVTFTGDRYPISGHVLPDFLFPQMQTPEFAPENWEPHFVDYLYLSFTNATAFSPTDVLPLTRWAKLTMMLQSSVALLLAILVIARAVNILK